jgi:ABC-2 type transport system permease protein
MIRYYFKYEWLSINRERWVIVLFVLFLVLTLFSVYNGKKKVNNRELSISKSIEEMKAIDRKYALDIDSLSKGLKPAPESWMDPRSLSVYGQRAARVAYMDTAPLAVIAIGQSDLFSHQVKPKLYGEANALGFSELSNPVQLLFGNFDLAFICIYLLPLLVLSFSYNMLSYEKELGSLRLTAAQPVSLYTWLFSKMTLRFIIVLGVVIISISLALIINGVSLISAGTDLLKLYLTLIAYTFFWFIASFLVNLFGWSSGKNAVTLVSIWVVVVLLLPSVINQMANTLHPVPSRINMLHEYRVASAEADQKSEENLKSYYHDHPDLAPRDSVTQNQYSWWLKYFASADMTRNTVKPVLDQFNIALAKQQEWVDGFRFSSPAILLQNSMNELAGTSPKHYADFREQVITFSETWRSYFLPRMFNNENMKSEDIASLPDFHYQTERVASSWMTDFFVLLFFIGLLVSCSLLIYRQESLEQMLT